jgi:hypothetical protein
VSRVRATDRADEVVGGVPGRVPPRQVPSWVGPAAIISTFVTSVVLAAWPGRMSNDTLTQIEQVRAGRFDDWHAAILLIAWRPFFVLGVGPGWVLWISALLLVAGLARLLRTRFGRYAAAVLACGVAFLPQVLGIVIYLGRDTWFTAFYLGAAASLAGAIRTDGRARVVRFGLFVVALWLMQAARQNALPVVAVLAVAGFRLAPLPRRRRTDDGSAPPTRDVGRWIPVVGSAFVTVALVVGSQAAVRSVFDVESTHPEQALFIYDVAALSHAEREVLFDERLYPAQDLAALDARWDRAVMHAYVFGPDAVLPFYVSGEQYEVLREDWVDAVRDHPSAYLRERLDLWLAESSISAPSSWIAHPGIDPNPWGYRPLVPRADAWLQSYMEAFAAGPSLNGGLVHEVWIYLVILLAGTLYLGAATKRRRLLGWLCLSGLAYQASLFVGLMGTAYRVNVCCVVIAIVVAIIAVADAATEGLAWVRGSRSRPVGDVPDTRLGRCVERPAVGGDPGGPAPDDAADPTGPPPLERTLH